jgi:hypothetical protein
MKTFNEQQTYLQILYLDCLARLRMMEQRRLERNLEVCRVQTERSIPVFRKGERL